MPHTRKLTMHIEVCLVVLIARDMTHNMHACPQASMSLTPHLPPLCDKEPHTISKAHRNRYVESAGSISLATASPRAQGRKKDGQLSNQQQQHQKLQARGSHGGAENKKKNKNKKEKGTKKKKAATTSLHEGEEEEKGQGFDTDDEDKHAGGGGGATTMDDVGDDHDDGTADASNGTSGKVHYLVDGGYMNNVPVQAMTKLLPMGGMVIANDIGTDTRLWHRYLL